MKSENKISFLKIWKPKILNKSFRNELLFIIFLLVVSLISLSNFLIFNELRNGSVLNDPLLNLFMPIDVTWITFLIIYVGLITGLIYLLKQPEILTLAFLTYTLTAFFRIAAMYSLPLNPPENIIPLNDPFVQLFGSGNILLKDLFFSGHTSTLFLLFLVIQNKKLKNLYLILTVSVAVCVLLQHVHYTIDVLAAPFFTYGAFKLSEKMLTFIRKIL